MWWPGTELNRRRQPFQNRGLKSWVQKQAQKAPQPRQNSALSPSTTLEMRMFRKHREDKGKHGSGNGNHRCAFIEECRQAL